MPLGCQPSSNQKSPTCQAGRRSYGQCYLLLGEGCLPGLHHKQCDPHNWYRQLETLSRGRRCNGRMENLSKSVVALPARNEEGHIEACLRALDRQEGAQVDDIILLLNNTTDATAAVARSVPLRPATQLHIVEVTLPPENANAGYARRCAMRKAARLAGDHGLILTTDADGMVMPDWLAETQAAIAEGAEAVLGWVALHPEDRDAIPAALHDADALECAYDELCDEIHSVLDPDPADPHPRHTQHSGASIAVAAHAFARCGGVPDVPHSEDRALVAALRRVDVRIRHSIDVHVSVSGRTEGRAVGGMADTIRRRIREPDLYIDDRLERAADCARRAWARAEARRCYHGADRAALARELLLAPAQLDTCLALPWFGTAWEVIERQSPALERRLVPVKELSDQTMAAKTILQQLTALNSQTDLAPIAPEPLLKARHIATIWDGFCRLPMRCLHPTPISEATITP